MLHRPRRLRKNPVVREMMAETKLSKDMFVYPYFIVPGKQVVHAIDAMPGVNHFSTDTLIRDVEKGLELGVNKIMLFGVGEMKVMRLSEVNGRLYLSVQFFFHFFENSQVPAREIGVFGDQLDIEALL